MTAAEIYESMDAFIESQKGKNFIEIHDAVRAHAAELGRSVGRTEDDILRFYFKMPNLGDRRLE